MRVYLYNTFRYDTIPLYTIDAIHICTLMQTIYIHQYAMDYIHSSSFFYVLTNFSKTQGELHESQTQKFAVICRTHAVKLPNELSSRVRPKWKGAKLLDFFEWSYALEHQVVDLR